jgi:hypothetical protein
LRQRRRLAVAGILLFWLMALLCYRLMSDESDVSPEIGAPRGMLLH